MKKVQRMGDGLPHMGFVVSNDFYEFNGGQYGVSYRLQDAIYESDTTAIVCGQMQLFLVLNGNHVQALLDANNASGLAGMLVYFYKQRACINKFSELQCVGKNSTK